MNSDHHPHTNIILFIWFEIQIWRHFMRIFCQLWRVGFLHMESLNLLIVLGMCIGYYQRIRSPYWCESISHVLISQLTCLCSSSKGSHIWGTATHGRCHSHSKQNTLIYVLEISNSEEDPHNFTKYIASQYFDYLYILE